MKKIIYILLLLPVFVTAQKLKADVIKFDSITSTVRDTYTVPYGEYWLIFNGTTGQFEYTDGSETWNPLGSDDQTLSEVLTQGATTGGTDLIISDNDAISIGTGSDLQIVHNGTNTYFDSYTGTVTWRDADNAFAQDFIFNFDSGTITAGGVVLGDSGTDDQTAAEVPITDTADNYPTDNVEAALAELATNSLTTSDIGVNVQAYSHDLDLVDGTNTGDETEATIKTKIAAGTGFDDAHIADGGISPVKLSADNSPTDDSDLTYESSTGNVVYATNRVKSNTTGLSNAVQITNIVAGNEADVSGWAVDANRLDVILDKKLIQEREIYLGAKGVDIETGTSVEIWPVFDAITITEVAAFSGTAPTGSTAIFDINEDGVSILSTNLSIDATEKWSSTATSTAVISDTTVDANSVISFDIDQVGSTVPGTDVVIKIKYYFN